MRLARRFARVPWQAWVAIVFAAVSGCSRASLSSPSPSEVSALQARPVSDRQADPPASGSASAHIQFEDVTSNSQVAFQHTDGSSGQFYFVEIAASGLATFDYDDDGLMDIYFLSGVPLRGAEPDAPAGGNALYRNLGGFRFEDVTRTAGVGQTGYGVGVTAGDYNNDGRQDLYVSNFGPKALLRNNGDGTFSDVTQAAGVEDGNQCGAGVSFLDIENDGDLDLYVANYVDFSYENHVPRESFGVPVYAAPNNFLPLRHSLYRNRGDGTFEDFSAASGIAARPGSGMGVICADYDDDGAADIVVCNDVAPNFCFHNDGQGTFTEVGAVAGLAYNVDGAKMGNMGVDCADYDGDGRLDFFVTTYHRELPLLFHNLGPGGFEDVTARCLNAGRSFGNSKWGCGFGDFDNDGHKDLFVGLGHLQVNIEQYDKTSSYAARPLLYRNLGNGKFEDVSESSGAGMQTPCVARGVALDDLDNDGRIDVVISNSRRRPVILRNTSTTLHHWLGLRLRGVSVNRDAVGARVQVTAGDLVQIDEVHSGRGYQSHFGSRLHFGLGGQAQVDKIEVRWPGGKRESWQKIQADQYLTLTEGTGTPGE